MAKADTNSPSNSPLMSEDVRVLIAALAKAKRSFSATGLAGSNSHQKYRYAKLDGIFGAVENALLDNGIAIVQHACVREDSANAMKGEILFTRLIHWETGQWIEDQRWLESEKPGNQGKGSAQTYMRKYAVLALCTLCPEDDDGEEEQKYIESGVGTLQKALRSATNGKQIYDALLKRYNIKDLSQIPVTSIGEVMTFIEEHRK
jgi:hypothetical protein